MTTSRIDYETAASATHRFFLYDPQGNGFLYFDSAQARDAAKDTVIQSYLDDGWDDDVEQVVAGEVTHTCQQVGREERPDESALNAEDCDAQGNYWGDCAYRCNYDLVPLLEPVPTQGVLIHAGWQWTLHQELNQQQQLFTDLGTDGVNPWGQAGVDYDPSYAVSRAAVYAGRDAVIYPAVKP